MSERLRDLTEDAFAGGQLRLRQPRSGHRAGHDAILLAAAAPARPGDRVVELGAGIGAAGLALAKRVGGIDLVLVEIESGLAALARDNAKANAVAAEIIELDINSAAASFAAAGLAPDSVDVVLMNPPFNDAKRHRASPDSTRASAHLARPDTLAVWTGAARRLLKSRGVLVLIWRADGLTDALAALEHGFGSLAILPVHGELTKPAIRVLLRAVKGGKAPTELLAGLMLNDASAGAECRVADIMAGKRALAWA
ncbi:MAG: tRNA1(Val) (adenine(37)-N6)-methyltransferase, partial [Bradyrhizobium sp.]